MNAQKSADYIDAIIVSCIVLRDNLDSPHWDEGLYNQLRNLKDDLQAMCAWVTQSKGKLSSERVT